MTDTHTAPPRRMLPLVDLTQPSFARAKNRHWLTPAELATLSPDSAVGVAPGAPSPLHFRSLLLGSILALNAVHVETLLAHPLATPEMLNKTDPTGGFDENGLRKATFLGCAATVDVKNNPENLVFKLGVINMLIRAGATNVNGCFYYVGESGLSAFSAICNGYLMEGIPEDLHKKLVQHFLSLGGDPFLRTHPIATTAYEIASETCPYLLEVLPPLPRDLFGKPTDPFSKIN
ncbi:MAG: hypothetical protein GC129_04950 [Proteobacteria bacterium]|nr:hypothetical protein [Pseudomonadota bacterium]